VNWYDVAIPVGFGLAFLFFAALSLIRGAEGVREQLAAAADHPLYPLWKWLRLPLRWWPERYDGLAAVIGGIIGLLMALMFFAIAVSVAIG